MSAEPLVDVSGPAAVRPGILESHGVESIPDGERTSAPRDFLWVWHSAQFSFASVVLGALPVLLGLGWWSSVTATVAGSVVGTAMMAPVAAFGIRTGTSDPESSGAHFGVRGRVIGNVITIAVAVGFFAIAVWTGGTAVMVAGSRWLGTPGGPGALAVTMPLVAVTVILIAVFGHEVLLATYKITAVIGGAVLLACVVVTWGRFDAGYAGGDYALGGFWPTWLQAAALAASLPLSYATF
jgi:purine-cytosine permease-like protein